MRSKKNYSRKRKSVKKNKNSFKRKSFKKKNFKKKLLKGGMQSQSISPPFSPSPKRRPDTKDPNVLSGVKESRLKVPSRFGSDSSASGSDSETSQDKSTSENIYYSNNLIMLIEEQEALHLGIPMTKEYGNLLQTSEFGKIKDNIFEVQDN